MVADEKCAVNADRLSNISSLLNTESANGALNDGNPSNLDATKAQVLVDEKCAENADRLGNLLRSELAAIPSARIAGVRGKGLLNAIIVKEQARYAMALCRLLHSNVRFTLLRWQPARTCTVPRSTRFPAQCHRRQGAGALQNCCCIRLHHTIDSLSVYCRDIACWPV